MKKKLLSLLIIIAITFSCVSMMNFTVFAASSGYCGYNLTWSYSGGTLTVSGSGSMYDYSSNYYSSTYITTAPWGSYYSTIKTVIIGNSVTSIGECAFSGCTGLTSVTIGDSVTSIGDSAFYGCSGLTSVTIGNGLTYIDVLSFYKCTCLASITVNSGNAKYYSSGNCIIEKTSNTLVLGCKNSVIPNTVTGIGEAAFSYCIGLKNIIIPNSVTSIGDSAFEFCSGLISITIPNGVKNINDLTFYFCSGLKSITIPDSVTSIGDCAFYGCSDLTSITIPDSVTSIGNDAFGKCDSLYYNTYGNAKYLGNSTKPFFALIEATNTSITTCNIYDNTKVIASYAFSYCTKLKNLIIPNSVINIGDYAFSYCDGLTSITVNSGNANYYSNGNCIIEKSTDTLILGCQNSILPNNVTCIGDGAFYGCNDLTSITIPDSVTSIGSYAFEDCSSLTSITIPNSVTNIGDWAFYECSGLTSITIPGGVTSIGYRAFSGCKNLQYNIYDNAKYLGNSTNQYYVLIEAKNTSNTSCNIHNNAKIICGGAFSLSNLTDITIGNNIISIGDSAFSNCDCLTSITIPDSVTSIGEWAFAYCSGLTSITIGNSVTTIGDYAFSECPYLNIHTSIDAYAKQYAIDNGIDYSTHTYQATWSNNSLKHWHECSICNAKKDVENHVYSSYTDTTCNTCGYVRTLKTFPDVTDKNAWYYAPIMYVSSGNIFSGYANGKFGISDNIQRQDFLVALARYSGENYNTFTTGKKFNDVSSGTYFANAVNWGSAKGIVSGYQNGCFGVGDNITREQLVLFFYRYAQYKGYDVSVFTNASYWRSKYSDFDNISTWARDAVIWALDRGIISGKQGKYIDPTGNAQRCEVATIFYKIDQNNVFSTSK